MTCWAIVYEDGSAFTNEDGAPHESPPWGAVVVVQQGTPDANARGELVNGLAFLWREDEQAWREVEEMVGLADQLAAHAHEIGAVRFGRYVAQTNWREQWDQAKKLREGFGGCG